MSAVVIRAQEISLVLPGADGYGSSGHYVGLGLVMTLAQRKAAILEMLGRDWSEQDAFEWLRSEFPAWFAQEVAA